MKRVYNYDEERREELTELHLGSAPEALQKCCKPDFLPMPCEAGTVPPQSFATWLLLGELPP